MSDLSSFVRVLNRLYRATVFSTSFRLGSEFPHRDDAILLSKFQLLTLGHVPCKARQAPKMRQAARGVSNER